MVRPIIGTPTWGDDLNADLDGIENLASVALDTAVAAGAGDLDPTTVAARNAQHNILGSGTRWVSSTGSVKWNGRFIVLGDGIGAHWSLNGFFDMDMPPVGTVITGVAGTTSRLVTADGIQLDVWNSLWYAPPVGAGGAMVPANFRVAGYFDVGVIPPHWIKIAHRHADEPVVKWGDGVYIPLGCEVEQVRSLAYYSGRGAPEGVVTAPYGTQYTDLNATTGAVTWIKSSAGTGSAGWKVLSGDTGWRTLSMNAGWAGTWQIRRIGQVVYQRTYNITGGTNPARNSFPIGFRPFEGNSYGMSSIVPGHTPIMGMAISGAPADVYLYNTDFAGSFAHWAPWITDDGWPVALP